MIRKIHELSTGELKMIVVVDVDLMLLCLHKYISIFLVLGFLFFSFSIILPFLLFSSNLAINSSKKIKSLCCMKSRRQLHPGFRCRSPTLMRRRSFGTCIGIGFSSMNFFCCRQHHRSFCFVQHLKRFTKFL